MEHQLFGEVLDQRRSLTALRPLDLGEELLDVTMVASNMTAAGIFAVATVSGTYQAVFFAGGALAVAGAAILILAHGVVARRVATAR